MASFRQFLLVGVVAPSAAQQVAPVDGGRRPEAAPALRAERSGGRVEGTVVGRGLEIDEVFLRRSVETPVLLDEGRALLVEADLRRSVVTLLQTEARVPETRQLVPTGLQAARPGHAVTLARDTSVLEDRLKTPKDHSQ